MTFTPTIWKLRAHRRAEPLFDAYCARVLEWSEQTRYGFEGLDFPPAEFLILAINDTEHGVLPWLKSHW